jgi:hypothetical protein
VNGVNFASVARLPFVGAFTRPHGLSLNVGRFWLSVRVAWLFRSVGSPLQCATSGQIPRVLRFLPSVRGLGRVRSFAALVG